MRVIDFTRYFLLPLVSVSIIDSVQALPSREPPRRPKIIIDIPIDIAPPPIDPEIQHEIDHHRCRAHITEMLDCLDRTLGDPNYQGPSCRSCLTSCHRIAPDFHGEDPSENPAEPPVECSRAVCADILGQFCPAPPTGPLNPKSLCTLDGLELTCEAAELG